ncbi:MAG: hypothetical protein E7632_02760 [Ruminococcaceae bacterium]|nr:hypothetical protein [Oscillospiraceae bacterium]
MKRILAVAMALVLALALVACGGSKGPDTTKGEGVMTYAEYDAAELQAEVVVETYVQGKQSWWDNKGTFYTQDGEGGYFIYEMPCTEEEYNKLVPGTKIRVKGFKAEFNGEIEIADVESFEILEGTWVADAMDATALLGTDDLIKHQNKLCAFKGLTVEAVEYKNGEPGDDIYVTLGLNGASYSFCVEVYLTGTESDVYKTVGALAVGDTVDVEAFLYWYQGANPHITKITKK